MIEFRGVGGGILPLRTPREEETCIETAWSERGRHPAADRSQCGRVHPDTELFLEFPHRAGRHVLSLLGLAAGKGIVAAHEPHFSGPPDPINLQLGTFAVQNHRSSTTWWQFPLLQESGSITTFRARAHFGKVVRGQWSVVGQPNGRFWHPHTSIELYISLCYLSVCPASAAQDSLCTWLPLILSSSIGRASGC